MGIEKSALSFTGALSIVLLVETNEAMHGPTSTRRINDVAQTIADCHDEVPSGPAPPPTPAPKKTPLFSSPSEVLVEASSDNCPGGMSWHLKNEETGEEILSGGDCADANTLFTDSGPMCPGACEFRIDD